MSDYHEGQWLAGTYNGYLIQVAEVGRVEGNARGVVVIASGQKVNTTSRYLDQNYRPLGDA